MMTELNLWQPLKVYLAARFERQEEMRGYRTTLENLGHVVTSRWLDQKMRDEEVGLASIEAAIAAENDIEDILTSDVIICFTEDYRKKFPRGGRHVELGISIGLRLNGYGPTIFLIGSNENVFHNAREIDGHFLTWQSLVDTLQKTSPLHGSSSEGNSCGAHPWHKSSAVHRSRYPHPLWGSGSGTIIDLAMEQLDQALGQTEEGKNEKL